MKSKWITIAGCAVLALVMLSACGRSGPVKSAKAGQAFDVKGVVRELDLIGKQVTIEHEDIPGFMPSMTMPFDVKDSTLLKGLAAGDAVKFHLVVTDRDSWITGIQKTGSGPAAAVPAPKAAPPQEAATLQPGDEVPDFALTGQDGQPFRLQDFRGKAVLVTFIYTRCPLPNFCPLMSRNFALLLEDLAKQHAGRFHLISISFDPEFDTPAVLRDYAANFTSNTANWTFACGTREQVNRVTSLFGLYHQPEGGQITHDLRTALIDPQGRLVHIWKSNVWTPQEVLSLVGEILPPLQTAHAR